MVLFSNRVLAQILAEADAQGVTRLARGEFFFATSRTRAASLGARFAWMLGTVPGVAHSDAGMSGPAAARLFAPP